MKNQQQPLGQVTTDEIDLLGLIVTIWQKKWWVFLCTFVFFGAGVFYALNIKEQWTSKAEVIKPRDSEVASMLQQQLAYNRITENKDDEDNKDNDLAERLYQSFLTELRSVNTKVDFLKGSALYQKLTTGMKSETEKQTVLKELVMQRISVQWPNKKKDITYPVLAFSAQQPREAKQTLEAYINYLNQQVFALEKDNFLLKIKNKIDEMTFELKRIEERFLLNRDIRLETQQKNLVRALATAKAAGIKDFAKTQVSEGLVVSELALGEADIKLADNKLSDNNFLFLMGEKYLQAQLDNVNKAPLVFPKEYHFKKEQLAQLKLLLAAQTKEITGQSFHYQSAPYLPLNRDAPKRGLIVLIATFLGGLIGIIGVLLMSAIAARKQQGLT